MHTTVGDTHINTLFLYVDHNHECSGPPILFVTTISGGNSDAQQWRYTTWQEAEDGHRKLVAKIKLLQTA